MANENATAAPRDRTQCQQRAEDFWSGKLTPTPELIVEAFATLDRNPTWWERQEAIAIRDAAKIQGLIPS